MTHHVRGARRDYRRSARRHVRVDTDVNRVGRREHLAKIITAAGLEQARLEAAAQADAAAQTAPADPEESTEEDHV